MGHHDVNLTAVTKTLMYKGKHKAGGAKLNTTFDS